MPTSALQNALNSLQSGAKAVFSATPPGQLAQRVSQAVSLVAPTLSDLHNAYNQTVARVSPVLSQLPQYNPVQTFQSNAQMLMHPIQSVTQETPAARFLINRIGGPAS